MARKFTNKLYDYIDNGLIDKDTVITACLKYMSEDEVKDMIEHNDLFETDEEEE